MSSGSIDRIEWACRVCRERVMRILSRHPDAEDAASYAVLQLLRNWDRIDERGETEAGLRRFALIVAHRAVPVFLASPQNRTRKHTMRGNPVPEIVPLTDIVELTAERSAGGQSGSPWASRRGLGLEREIVTRVYVEWLHTELLSLIGPEQWRLVFMPGDKGSVGDSSFNRTRLAARQCTAMALRRLAPELFVDPSGFSSEFSNDTVLLSPQDEWVRYRYLMKLSKSDFVWCNSYSLLGHEGHNVIRLARIILGLPRSEPDGAWSIRHRNDDPLDHRRENLIILTQKEDQRWARQMATKGRVNESPKPDSVRARERRSRWTPEQREEHKARCRAYRIRKANQSSPE